ncbi:MAG TPA: hypothetical protein DET40_26040 [Lentisphaeria bacterium]|nr:MAG: hypothetical protein A2X45_12880 [Lentisphaerae bacterium GWF2_50_93]HCE47024.1 hypothetical protein [Lentisphaeria bacterium]
MKSNFLILSCLMALLLLTSCKSAPDQHITYFNLAEHNLKVAEETQEPKDQEKYYIQALMNYYKYIVFTDTSKASGDAKMELNPDDGETLIEAKIKAKKCKTALKDRFNRNCIFQESVTIRPE